MKLAACLEYAVERGRSVSLSDYEDVVNSLFPDHLNSRVVSSLRRTHGECIRAFEFDTGTLYISKFIGSLNAVEYQVLLSTDDRSLTRALFKLDERRAIPIAVETVYVDGKSPIPFYCRRSGTNPWAHDQENAMTEINERITDGKLTELELVLSKVRAV